MKVLLTAALLVLAPFATAIERTPAKCISSRRRTVTPSPGRSP